MATILPVGLALYGVAAVAIPAMFLVSPNVVTMCVKLVSLPPRTRPTAIRKRAHLDPLRQWVNAVRMRRQMYRGLHRA